MIVDRSFSVRKERISWKRTCCCAFDSDSGVSASARCDSTPSSRNSGEDLKSSNKEEASLRVDAEPRHPGIELEVQRRSPPTPFTESSQSVEAFDAADDRGQAVLPQHRRRLRRQGGEHEDLRLNVGFAQLDRLFGGGDGEPGEGIGASGSLGFERPGDRHGAVAVSVGLDYGEDLGRRYAPGEQPEVAFERRKIDLDPGSAKCRRAALPFNQSHSRRGSGRSCGSAWSRP